MVKHDNTHRYGGGGVIDSDSTNKAVQSSHVIG